MQSNPETLPLFPGLPTPGVLAHPSAVTPAPSARAPSLPSDNTDGSAIQQHQHLRAANDREPPGVVPQQKALSGFEAPASSLKQASRKQGAQRQAWQMQGRRDKIPIPEPVDYHMAIAWRLSKAMKGVRTGHRDARNLRRMTPGERHRVGNVICEHLRAALRAQVEAESRDA